jgi:hypothetical protein
MRRNRRNCRLRLGLADRARGRGIAAGRYYNSRSAKLFPRFSGQPQEIDQTKVNAVDFLFSVQTPAGSCLGCRPIQIGSMIGRRCFGSGGPLALGDMTLDAPPEGLIGTLCDEIRTRLQGAESRFRLELSCSSTAWLTAPSSPSSAFGQGGAAARGDDRYEPNPTCCRKAQSPMA